MSNDRLQLFPLFEATAAAETVADLPGTPRGTMRVTDFTSFDCTGQRLTASLHQASAAEWTMTAPDGTSTADGRIALRTADSETAYMRWVSRWDAETDGPAPPRIVARFEANGGLAWLNKIIAVGAVAREGNQRRYELFELAVRPEPSGDEPTYACRLEPLLELHNTVEIADAISLPNTMGGHRLIGAVSKADCFGPRIRAHLRGRVAGDWALMSPEQTVVVDVTETLETDDGALVHLNYRGTADVSQGGYSAPSYVCGFFETGDPRYAWMNKLLTVGEGRHDVAEVVMYHYYAVC